MFDEELRERLADWVRPVTGLPVPDIRVLRRRARRRMMRRVATGTTMTAVAAVAVLGITANLPPGRSAGDRPGGAPSASSWGPAPGTWNHGAWQPAGPSLAADASPAAAPYIVIPWDRGAGLQVRNVFAGQAVAFVPGLSGQYIGAVAGAGDDLTFVVQAETGGQSQGPGMPPVGATMVAFDELKLRADGQLASLKLLFAIPMRDSLYFAISQDASMLAYSTDNDSGFETVSLATGTARSWPAVDAGGVAPLSLSWAGDRTLVFQWGPADNRHPPGTGIRVLDVKAAGNLLQASRLVVAYSRYCLPGGGWGCIGDPVITPDGSRVIVTKGEQKGGVYTNSVVEYSTRTGQAVASVAPPVSSAFPGVECVPLWTDPSGEQVITLCGGFQHYDRGRVTRITMHPPMNGTDILPFGWQPGSSGF